MEAFPRKRCTARCWDARPLNRPLANYKGEPVKEQEGEIVCECFGVTDLEIERAIRENNLSTVEEVTNYTKAGGGCENCHDTIRNIIARRCGAEEKPAVKPRLSNIKKDQDDRRDP